MILLLLFAFGLTCATVLIHALGTWEAIVYLAGVWSQRKRNQGFLATELQIVRVVSVMLLLHLVEAGVWAGFYRISGVLPELETAIYFSITSYTTVGYGDVVLLPPWRLLGPIEAAVGILMFGWSTAIIVAVVTRIQGNRLARETEASDESPP
jgi:voltage-gated potassium channel